MFSKRKHIILNTEYFSFLTMMNLCFIPVMSHVCRYNGQGWERRNLKNFP